MEAGNWEELDFLLKEAGLTAEQIIGMENDFPEDEGPIPSPKTFQENLKLHFKGEELQVPYPDMTSFEVYGTRDLKEELYTPPPFMDMENFLRPEPATPETLEEVRRLATHLGQADQGSDPVNSDNCDDEIIIRPKKRIPLTKTSTAPSSEPVPISSVPRTQTNRPALKRRRVSLGGEEEDKSGSSPAPMEVGGACADEDSAAAIVILSGSSSSGKEDTPTPIIDLTQQ